MLKLALNLNGVKSVKRFNISFHTSFRCIRDEMETDSFSLADPEFNLCIK